VDDRTPGQSSTHVPCEHCGNPVPENRLEALRSRPENFQVIVACASCGSAFAALSRN
jgi:hypothetical protein